MNPRVVYAIVRKDMIDAIRNRYLLIALLTPLLMALIFRVVLPYAGRGLGPTLIVHDAGQSALISNLRAIPQVKLFTVNTASELSEELNRRRATAALDIPANFDAEVIAGKTPELKVYLIAGKSNIEQIAFKQLLEQQLLALAKQPLPAKLVWIQPIEGARKPAGSDFSLNQIVPLFLLLMTVGMTGGLVVPLLLVEEKERRTLDFLLLSPGSLGDVIAGKALAGLAYVFMIVAVLFALNHSFLSNWLPLVVTISLGAVLLVSIGLVIGSLFHNTMQVNTWAGFVLLVLLTPSFVFGEPPAALRPIIRLIPTYYFVDALKLSLAGADFVRIWKDSLVNLLLCGLLLYVATRILGRTER
jgi:ABC-2 type transport system permease protein